MWVEFIYGSRPCSKDFLPVVLFSFLHKNVWFLNSNSIRNLRVTGLSVDCCNTVFTLKRNMFSLITNETCFTVKRSHQAVQIMRETRFFSAGLNLPHEKVSISARWNTLNMAWEKGSTWRIRRGWQAVRLSHRMNAAASSSSCFGLSKIIKISCGYRKAALIIGPGIKHVWNGHLMWKMQLQTRL